MRLSFAPFGYRLLVTQPRGPFFQEATKEVRQSLEPAVLMVLSQRVGVLAIQRPSDPIDVHFRDVEFDPHSYFNECLLIG